LGPEQTASSIDQADRPKSSGSIESTETMPISVDMPMPDAPPSSSVSISNPPQPPHPVVFIPPSSSTANEHRAPDLRVQMPYNPSFSSSPPAAQLAPSGSVTPSSTNGSITQSPFCSLHFSPSVLNSVGQHPSPVKKKLSLKDYKARLASASRSSSGDGESTPATLRPSTSLAEESKMPGILEGSVVLDSPVVEKGTDPLTDTSDTLKAMQPAVSDSTM
jgi:hypothetical protein